MQPFMNREGALQADVNSLHRVSLKCVARLVADPVIVSKHVAIGVKAGVFSEVLRGLQGKNRTETEVAHEYVPALGAVEDGFALESMPAIVRRTGALRMEVGAVLPNQHEAGI